MKRIRWKIVVLGDGGVGKTTFLHRYINGSFLENTKLTIGVEFHTIFVEKDGNTVEFVLWDLGGQDRFRFFQENYIKGSRAAIIAFDMNRLSTLAHVNDWVALVREFATKDCPIILVGMKKDLIAEQHLSDIEEAAKEKMENLGLKEVQFTSSKENYNVKETFDRLIDFIFDQIEEKKIGQDN